MTVPGPGIPAVVGLMVIGLAAAPVFPLLALRTAWQAGTTGGHRASGTVGLQVAASAIGGALLPAGIGVAIGAASATVLAPSLLVLSLAMSGLYWLVARSYRRMDRPG